MLFDRYVKAALALIALSLVGLMKKKHGGGELEQAYQRGFENGFQQGRAQQRSPAGGWDHP